MVTPRAVYSLGREHLSLYISDTSVNSQRFWDAACKNVEKYSLDEKLKAEETDSPEGISVRTELCKRHEGSASHYHVVNFNHCRCDKIKWSLVFPPSCDADHAHQRVRMNAVWNMYVDRYGADVGKRIWLKFFKCVPIGVSYIWVVSNLLWLMLCDAADQVWK